MAAKIEVISISELDEYLTLGTKHFVKKEVAAIEKERDAQRLKQNEQRQEIEG